MYKLTKLDKFYIKNLISLRSNGLNKNDIIIAIDTILLMKNNELANSINKILHGWENDWNHSKTSIENDLFNYCKELVKKLINGYENGFEEIIINDENLELKNIHPDIHFHIKNLYNDGYYANAVEESYKITRKKLVELTGNKKAHEAFKEGNEEIIFGKQAKNGAEKDFFKGVKFLHMAIQNFRNEKAHTPAKDLDKNRAIHYIYLASLALYLIDKK